MRTMAQKLHDQRQARRTAKDRPKVERCKVCHKPVRVQIFKNSGLCSGKCRKIWEAPDEEW